MVQSSQKWTDTGTDGRYKMHLPALWSIIIPQILSFPTICQPPVLSLPTQLRPSITTHAMFPTFIAFSICGEKAMHVVTTKTLAIINPRTVSKITYVSRFLGSVWTPMLIWTFDPWIPELIWQLMLHYLEQQQICLTDNKNITRFGSPGSKRTPENGSRVNERSHTPCICWEFPSGLLDANLCINKLTNYEQSSETHAPCLEDICRWTIQHYKDVLAILVKVSKSHLERAIRPL